MLKGAIIGLMLFVAGDMAFNEGRYTHIAKTKLTGFAHASSDSVNNSVFRQ